MMGGAVSCEGGISAPRGDFLLTGGGYVSCVGKLSAVRGAVNCEGELSVVRVEEHHL